MAQRKIGLWLVDRWGGKIAFLGRTGFCDNRDARLVYAESGRPYRYPYSGRSIQLLDETSKPKSPWE